MTHLYFCRIRRYRKPGAQLLKSDDGELIEESWREKDQLLSIKQCIDIFHKNIRTDLRNGGYTNGVLSIEIIDSGISE